MSRILAMGDRLVAKALRQSDAGACVPDWNMLCGCVGFFAKLIDCNGVCRRTQLACP